LLSEHLAIAKTQHLELSQLLSLSSSNACWIHPSQYTTIKNAYYLE